MEFEEDELVLIMNSLLFVSKRLDSYINNKDSNVFNFVEALRTQGDLLLLIDKVQNKIEEV